MNSLAARVALVVIAGCLAPEFQAEDRRGQDLNARLLAALTLKTQGDLESARQRLEGLVVAHEEVLGVSHPEALVVRSHLASALEAQGKLRRALALFEEVLEARRWQLGDAAPETLAARLDVARALESLGKERVARRQREQVFDSAEELLEDDVHQATLLKVEELALDLKEQDDSGPARRLQERVLEVREAQGGDDDQDTLIARSLLAWTLIEEGDLNEASDLQEQVLEVRERLLGIDHAETLTARLHLAGTLSAQGQLEAARRLQEQVLRSGERLVGEEASWSDVAHLAVIFREQGNLPAARELQQQLAAARDETSGQDPAQTLATRTNLAWTFVDEGDLWPARRIQESLLADLEQLLPKDAPDVLTARLDLASTIYVQGDLEAARALQASVVGGRSQSLRPDHPHTLTAQDHLALTLQALGDLDGAQALQEHVVAERRRQAGDTHPETARARTHLAWTLKRQGDLDEAQGLQEQVLAGRAQFLGGDHPATLEARAELALTLKEQGDLGAAHEHLEQVMETLERALEGDPTGTSMSFSRGAQLAAERQLAERLPSYSRSLRAGLELAEVRNEQGDSVTAGSDYRQLLSSLEDRLGAGDPLVDEVGKNIAETLRAPRDLAADHANLAHLLTALKRWLGDGQRETWISQDHSVGRGSSQGVLDDARELFETLLEARERLLGDDHPDTLSARSYLASILVAQGDLRPARDLLQRIVTTREQLLPSDHPDVWASRLDLARTLFVQGDLGAARELLERVVAAHERLFGDTHPKTLTARHNLARTLYAQGDLGVARELFERVSQTRERLLNEDHPDTVRSQLNLARIHYALGDLDVARELEEKGLQSLEVRLGERHPDTLMARLNLASTLYAAGYPATAQALEEQVLAARVRTRGVDHPDTSRARLNLAVSLRALGDSAGARDLLEQALEALDRVLGSNHPTTARARVNLAISAQLTGELEIAEALLLKALTSQRKLVPGTLQEAVTLELLAALHARTQRLELAADFYRQALAALDGQIGRLGGSPDLRGTFRARHARVYRQAIEFFVLANHLTEALETLERHHGRSFVAMLRERELRFAALPEELDRQRRILAVRHDRIVHQMSDLSPGRDREELKELEAERLGLRRRYSRLADTIRLQAPGLADLQEPRPLDLLAIRETLDLGTVMLAYSVGETTTLLFVMTKDGPLEVHSLAIDRQTLKERVDEFRELVGCTGRRCRVASRVELGRWLYRELVELAEVRVEESDRLLIVPDGPLHRLPFAAMVRDTGEVAGAWQYLVEWKPVHSALSVSVYRELKEGRRSESVDEDEDLVALAAFGDPRFRLAGSSDDARVRFAVDQGFRLRPLPFTRREVEQISGFYPPRAVRAYLGEKATEERVRSIGAEAPRILHFATHHNVVPHLPLDSFLALTLPEASTEDRDNGLLQAWEIFERVRIDADLVVLSACGSALGEEVDGEGLVGLTRAFQYAGARSVAATLWQVPDRTTAELMVRFYRHLQAGKTKDVALRAAQIELIRGPIQVMGEEGRLVEKNASAPYYWAAFQIIGDWQ